MITKRDAHKNFKLLMDKSASGAEFGGCPAFLTEEIDALLDQAALEVISNKYSGTQNQVGFEGNAKRITDLNSLIGTAIISINSTNEEQDTTLLIDNCAQFTLPEDFMFYVDSIVQYTKGNDTKLSRVRLISHEESSKFIHTDDNNPYIPDIVAVLEGDKITIYYDLYTVDNIVLMQLNYIFRPTKFEDLNADDPISDFNNNVLNEIINRAVVIALENIESQRVNTKAQLNGVQE